MKTEETESTLEISYADGTSRVCTDDLQQVTDLLRTEMGCEPVILNGLVWTAHAAEEHPDDDGLHAYAEILSNGERIH